MHLSTISQKELFLTIIIVCALGISTAFAQSNDNYLKSLEGEAANLVLDGQENPNQTVKKPKVAPSVSVNENVSNTTTSSRPGEGRIPVGLTFSGFLDNLKTNYIGTYFFTKRLSPDQRNEIYSFYQKNNDPQAVRSQVIQISKKN